MSLSQKGFYKKLFRYCEGWIELRALKKREGFRDGPRNFFEINDYDGIKKWCNINALKYNVYHGVGTRLNNTNGTKQNLQDIPAVWCDVDFKDIPKKEAKDLIWNFTPVPSIVLSSGYGYHVYWLLKEAHHQEDIENIEHINLLLAGLLHGDTNACDAARILRIPGTYNHKLIEKTPEVTCEMDNNNEYDLSDFDEMSEDVTKCQKNVRNLSQNVRNSETQKIAKCQKVSETCQKVSLQKGNRDATIFHVANCLNKGGMDKSNICEIVKVLASQCTPSFEPKEAMKKVSSALKRTSASKANVSETVTNWIEKADREFTVKDVIAECALYNTNTNIIYKILSRLCNASIIEKSGKKRGVYRKLDATIEWLDFQSIHAQIFPFVWPFELEKLVHIQPKNICVIAGDANSGKTALMLNLIRMNQNRGMNIYYFSSEMSPAELNHRLLKFEDMPISEWNFQMAERSENFADAIQPEGVNLIDFLEISDNFFQIGGQLTDIFNKLTTGIAVIAIQKAPGCELARGGAFTTEKPRLYLSISNAPDGHYMKIVKAKNWANPDYNPNYKRIKFKLRNGCHFIRMTDWEVA